MPGPRFERSYDYADVIRRSVPCCTSDCRAPAIYDVSLRNRQGVAGEYIPLCARHTERLIIAHHLRARVEEWPGYEDRLKIPAGGAPHQMQTLPPDEVPGG